MYNPDSSDHNAKSFRDPILSLQDYERPGLRCRSVSLRQASQWGASGAPPPSERLVAVTNTAARTIPTTKTPSTSHTPHNRYLIATSLLRYVF